MEKALSWCEPRSASYSLRFLPNDLPSLLDYGLVRTGLAARIPGVDVVHVADELDGYVRREALTEIKRRFRPLESSTNPNVVLRVPTHAWILHQASVGPPAVVAADLLVNPDGRVVRAGRRLLESIARHWNPRSRS